MRYAGLLYYIGNTPRGTLAGAVDFDGESLAGAVDAPSTSPGEVSDRSILLVGRID